MFMQPIQVPVAAASDPKPRAAKLAVGLLFMLASVVIMVPYLLAMGLWIGLSAAGILLGKLVKTAYDSVIFAGEVVLGR
jgi:hypothetical protein